MKTAPYEDHDFLEIYKQNSWRNSATPLTTNFHSVSMNETQTMCVIICLSKQRHKRIPAT